MEVTRVYITNIPVIITGDIKIQIAEVTAEETKKEEFSESFKIECDMQEETIPREENREVMPIEENDPEKCIFKDESEFKWVKVNGKWRKRKNVEGKSSGRKKRIPFSCCHCEFIGNNVTELRYHKRDMDSQIFFLVESSLKNKESECQFLLRNCYESI